MSELRIDDLLDASLVFCDVYAENKEDLLRKLCSAALDRGYIKESYYAAVIERENEYPTGLNTNIIKVALPHTVDKSHVLKPAIVAAKLRQPVIFKEMGEGEADIPVEIVFMLAVNAQKDQLTILHKIVGLFIKEKVLRELKQASDPAAIVKCIKENLED